MMKADYHAKPATIAKLLQALKKDRGDGLYHRALKTCTELGWFTDGRVLSKLTEEEHRQYIRDYGKDKAVKESKPLPIHDILPKQVTLMLSFVEARKETEKHPALVVMEATGGRRIYLQADLYQLLIKRHPKAIFYLTEPPSDNVAVSERNTVAMVSQYKEIA